MNESQSKDDLATQARRVIRRHAPSALREADLADDLKLMKGGLGLDSLAAIELLLACEQRFGVDFSEDFLNQPAMTIGLLIEEIHRLKTTS